MAYSKEELEKLIQYGSSGSKHEGRELAQQLISAITTIERLEAKQLASEKTAEDRWQQQAINYGLSPVEAKIAAIINDNQDTYAVAAEIAETFRLGLPRDVTEEQKIVRGITVLAEKVSRTAHEHGWWETQSPGHLPGAVVTTPIERNMGEMLMLMVSELAEGMESVRADEPFLWYDYGNNLEDGFLEMDPEVDGILGKPCGLASEFADTIIRILDTCVTVNIPIAEALVRKAAYNDTRPYRHGGKLA